MLTATSYVPDCDIFNSSYKNSAPTGARHEIKQQLDMKKFRADIKYLVKISCGRMPCQQQN
jgi:hypothetical protein